MPFLDTLNKGETFIIGEVAQAHDGSLRTAHQYVDLIADCGVNAVKFQTHIASAESTIREPWRVKMATSDKTRFDYWKRMEFTESEWAELRDHCVDRKVSFLSSPFSVEAVELLDQLGVEVWKIASGEVSNIPMITAMLATKKPIILSTGLSKLNEIDKLATWILGLEVDLTVLQCTSEYPCPAELTGLNVISDFKNRWRCRVGLSDHSGTIFPSLAARSLGASVLELHVTSSRDAGGVDGPSSVTPIELKELVRGVRFLDTLFQNPVDKSVLSPNAEKIKTIFGRSVVAKYDLATGHVVSLDDLAYKKPGGGLQWEHCGDLLGKSLKRSILKDDLITVEDTTEVTQ